MMEVVLMRAMLPIEAETVSHERTDKLTGSERTKWAVVDAGNCGSVTVTKEHD